MPDNLTITVQRPTLAVTLGTIPQGGSVGADLTAIEALSTTGFPARTASDTWALRSFADTTGLTWTNPAGVAGNPSLALDAGLVSLASVDTGADLLPYTTGANTWSSTALTSFARTLLDDTDAATALATLGISAVPLVDRCTDGVNTTDNTTGVDTGASWALTTGLWIIECWFICTSSATTTAPQFALVASGGLTVTSHGAESHVYSGANARQAASENGAIGSFTSQASNGPGASERFCIYRAMVDVSVAGTATLYLRSEVSGQIVTVVKGGGRALRLG